MSSPWPVVSAPSLARSSPPSSLWWSRAYVLTVHYSPRRARRHSVGVRARAHRSEVQRRPARVAVLSALARGGDVDDLSAAAERRAMRRKIESHDGTAPAKTFGVAEHLRTVSRDTAVERVTGIEPAQSAWKTWAAGPPAGRPLSRPRIRSLGTVSAGGRCQTAILPLAGSDPAPLDGSWTGRRRCSSGFSWPCSRSFVAVRGRTSPLVTCLTERQ